MMQLAINYKQIEAKIESFKTILSDPISIKRAEMKLYLFQLFLSISSPY